MKTRCIVLLILSVCYIFDSRYIFDGRAAGADPEELARSLRDRVVSVPDSVLGALDRIEAQKRPALRDYQIDLLRGLAYNEKRMFSLVERYARLTLQSDSISAHPQEKLNALTLLSVAQSFFGDYESSIQTSIKGMELARAEGNKASEYNILTTMAKTSFTMGNRRRGYQYLDQIISDGSNSTDARVLANVSAAYGVKIVELYADDRFDEGLTEGRTRLALIDRIDRIGGSPEGFTDQQRAYAYARIASCAEQLGRKEEARVAYDAFMATDYAKNPIGRVYIMDYLLDSGQWNKVLEFTAPLYPMFEGGDTINGDYYSLLISDGRAQAGLGNFREGYGLIQRAAAIQDSLSLREKRSRAQEMASVFALNEKELALANEKARSQRKHMLLIAACGIALLVLIILIQVWRAYRVSVKQQQLAAQRINELAARQLIDADATPENEADYHLFVEMQNKIIRRLYLNHRRSIVIISWRLPD